MIFRPRPPQNVYFIESLRNDNEGEAYSNEILLLFAALGWYCVVLRGEPAPASAFVIFPTGLAAGFRKIVEIDEIDLWHKGYQF